MTSRRQPYTTRCRFHVRMHVPAWLFAGLLATGTIAVTPLSASHAALIEQLLAVVNGKTITLTDLRRYQLLFAPDAPPEQVLQQMIDHQLLLVEAVRFDAEPPDQARILATEQRLKQSAGGQAAWEAALQRVQLTPDRAEEMIIDELRVESFLAQRVDQFVIVTRTEVEAAYDQQPERYQGKTLAEVEPAIERELVHQKMTVKRQEYMARLRSHASITLLTDKPGTLPARP